MLERKLLFGCRDGGGFEQLAERRAAHPKRLIQNIDGVVGLEFADNLRNLRHVLLTYIVEDKGGSESLGLYRSREAEDLRSNALHKRINESEVLAGIQERRGQRGGNLLTQEGVKRRSRNLKGSFKPRRDSDAHDDFSVRVQLLSEEGEILMRTVFHQLAELDAFQLRPKGAHQFGPLRLVRAFVTEFDDKHLCGCSQGREERRVQVFRERFNQKKHGLRSVLWKLEPKGICPLFRSCARGQFPAVRMCCHQMTTRASCSGWPSRPVTVPLTA